MAKIHAPSAQGSGLIPGQGMRPHAVTKIQHSQIKTKTKKVGGSRISCPNRRLQLVLANRVLGSGEFGVD